MKLIIFYFYQLIMINSNFFSDDGIKSNIPIFIDNSNYEGIEIETCNSDKVNDKKEIELYDQINK